MITRVIKRDGRKAVFSERRIQESISAAIAESGEIRYGVIGQVVQGVVNAIDAHFEDTDIPRVEQIQDIITRVLKEMGLEKTATAFTEYRDERTKTRNIKSDVMRAIGQIGEETVRDNANVGNNFSAKLLQIASIANKYWNLANMPKEQAKAHEVGDLHLHDLDSYNLTTNCLHVPLKKAFDDGFNTGYGTIRKPQRIESAGELACIILQSSQNDMFGGQSFANFDNDMADIVPSTREKVTKEIEDLHYIFSEEGSVLSEEDKKELVEARVHKHVRQAMQGVVYNLNTMHSRAGSQVPFSSINLGVPKNEDAALVCQMFLEEYEKGLGMGEQPIFPNIIFRTKKGVNVEPEDPYYYLRLLAERVAAKRMNPTFRNLDSSVSLPYYNRGILAATMGCRTETMANINGEDGPEGRGNIAPVSMNLPRIGIEAKGNWDKFYKNLDKLMDLCADNLMHRKGVLAKLRVKDLPFVAGQGLMKGSEGLSPDDSIEPILRQGTWSIGFIGLAETMVAMTGHHHGEGGEYWDKAYEIVKHMREKTDEYRQKYQLNFSCYATPAEGLSGRFTVIDKKRYGIIPGVTDKEYYTNSYHIPVNFSMSAMDKLGAEAPFHKLCNAGHISYVELDGGDVETRTEFIHRINTLALNNTDISYYAFNFHIRYCKHDGKDVVGSQQFCPVCGSGDIQGVSRVTGYMSLDERFTPGKVAERRDRKAHN